MIELEARAFMGATVELRSLMNLIDRIEDKQSLIGDEDIKKFVLPRLEPMITALRLVGAKSAIAAADRLKNHFALPNPDMNYAILQLKLNDIESRFADHLDDIKLLVLHEEEARLLDSADSLVNVEGFSAVFPKASLEIEESAKCIAFGRYTASVFHTMRALEIGIEAIAKFLEIPDPTKASERSWTIILGKISEKMDEKWPKKLRVKNSEGARFEALYATLDAVKNPWRNATMHVEAVYMPHEALHIARCGAAFLMKLSDHCVEDGTIPVMG